MRARFEQMSPGAYGVKHPEGVMVLTTVVIGKHTISLPFILSKIIYRIRLSTL